MSDEWYTPRELFEALSTRFDLDVCAPDGGAPYVPADKFYTKEDDGLVSKWEGFVWMNPPYSKPKPWVDRWLDHGNGLALLPAAKSKWFDELFATEARYTLLPATFKFVSPEGDRISLMMASTLWAVGDTAVEILINSGIGKVR